MIATQQFPVEYLIYFYMFICAALLLFNVVYILGESGRKRARARRERVWRREILRQLEKPAGNGRHARMVARRLRALNQLMAFHGAAESLQAEHADGLRRYLTEMGYAFQSLCIWYAKRDSMERAYFAWFVARFRPYRSGQSMFHQLLVGYLENATVYCRENVLQAICASGRAEAVETAFQFMNDHEIFHHPKLLADGLLRFTGDRKRLARILWSHHARWSSGLMVSIVQFITGCADGFQEEFLSVAENRSADRELRLAILRYFRRYPFDGARPLLLRLAAEAEGSELAIVASFVLDRYPGEDTLRVLKGAVCSRNWYVRSNAAVSLLHLDAGEDALREFENGDRYAREMLIYQKEQLEAQREAAMV